MISVDNYVFRRGSVERSCNIRDKSVQLSILGHNCMHLSNIVINGCQLEGQCSLGLRNYEQDHSMEKSNAWDSFVLQTRSFQIVVGLDVVSIGL